MINDFFTPYSYTIMFIINIITSIYLLREQKNDKKKQNKVRN